MCRGDHLGEFLSFTGPCVDHQDVERIVREPGNGIGRIAIEPLDVPLGKRQNVLGAIGQRWHLDNDRRQCGGEFVGHTDPSRFAGNRTRRQDLGLPIGRCHGREDFDLLIGGHLIDGFNEQRRRARITQQTAQRSGELTRECRIEVDAPQRRFTGGIATIMDRLGDFGKRFRVVARNQYVRGASYCGIYLLLARRPLPD